MNILDAVRNLVLDWTIELERAGVTGEGISFTSGEQQQAQDISINVGHIGSLTGNLGVGIASGDIINAPVNVEHVRNLVSQVKSHAQSLTNEGVDEVALSAAVQAIEKQMAAGNQTLLRHALAELETRRHDSVRVVEPGDEILALWRL